jgi:hypothetical protein
MSPTESKDSPQKRDGQAQRPARTKTLCQVCGKGYHKPDDYWKQYLEKALKRSTNPTLNITSGDETKQTTSQELVLRNHSQANLVASTHIMDPTQLKEP